MRLGVYIYIVPLLVLAVLAALGLSALWQSDTSDPSGETQLRDIGFSMTGKSAPELILPAYADAGSRVMLADWQGEVYAINVFASWCAPCRAEAPTIAKLAETIPIIGINFRDAAEDAAEFLALFGNPYAEIGVDADGQASLGLGVQAIPETLIVNKAGEIIFHQRGPIFADVLTGEIARVLTLAQ